MSLTRFQLWHSHGRRTHDWLWLKSVCALFWTVRCIPFSLRSTPLLCCLPWFDRNGDRTAHTLRFEMEKPATWEYKQLDIRTVMPLRYCILHDDTWLWKSIHSSVDLENCTLLWDSMRFWKRCDFPGGKNRLSLNKEQAIAICCLPCIVALTTNRVVFTMTVYWHYDAKNTDHTYKGLIPYTSGSDMYA